MGKIKKLESDKKVELLMIQETKMGSVFHQSFECVVVNLYAPNDDIRMKQLWDLIINIKPLFNTPWCIGGDFNGILRISERRGCTRSDRGMNNFNEFIDRMEFLDMPMLGRNFTWCNSFEGDTWSRIDRFLVNPIWLEKFELKLWGLPRSIFDHCLLLLMEDDRNWGPRPFRFLNAWTLHPKFLELVRRTRSENEIEGWTGYRFMRKLYALKGDLKIWSTKIFGNVENQLRMAEEELHELDLKAEAGPLLKSETQKRRVVRDLVWKLSKRKQ
ncbi:uncharacterized protein LOC114301728 [Camellia sinensis]|uniref:uncharacterized protein LOC114301728 n=1 Tax=Camellia sinensis TaxID=4442 RepID=UPI0010357216|nr:uncharacterized protein LOC114301728 [Camellia sinensis]